MSNKKTPTSCWGFKVFRRIQLHLLKKRKGNRQREPMRI